MPRPYRVRGGWLGVILVVALPTAVIGLAVYYQAYFEGWQGSIGIAMIALASGPILYPFLAARRRRLGIVDDDSPFEEVTP